MGKYGLKQQLTKASGRLFLNSSHFLLCTGWKMFYVHFLR